MGEETTNISELFTGLQALAKTAFPRKCDKCGKMYNSIDEFMTATQSAANTDSGLKETTDTDGEPIVELIRNCVCGSTLKGEFGDRRDVSEAGLRRRRNFGEVLEHLIEEGLDVDLARGELLKLIRGGKSEILDKYMSPKPAKEEGAGQG